MPTEPDVALDVPRSDLHAVLAAALDLALAISLDLSPRLDRLIACANAEGEDLPAEVTVDARDLQALLPRFWQVLGPSAPDYVRERCANEHPDLEQHHRVLRDRISSWLTDHPEPEEQPPVTIPAVGLVRLFEAYMRLHPVAGNDVGAGEHLAALAHVPIELSDSAVELIQQVWTEVSRVAPAVPGSHEDLAELLADALPQDDD